MYIIINNSEKVLASRSGKLWPGKTLALTLLVASRVAVVNVQKHAYP
jgi:hypothetical protein